MFSARFMCAVCNKCVLIGTNSVACWYPLQTVWTQIRPDKKLGLIWIRTVWHSYWWYPSKTFWKEFSLSKATACEKKPVQLFSMQKVQPFTYQPRGCRLLLLPPCCFRYLILNECARSSRICDKYQTFLNWPIKFGLSLHLHPFFLLRFAKALARLRQCEVSSDPLMFVYAINTKLSWTGL